MNAITSRTGCGLLLDAYNLECDAFNQGLDIAAFLEELDLRAVRELHLAGGIQRNGFQLDIHSGRTCDKTLALGLDIIQRAPNLLAVTFEFLKETVTLIGHDGIDNELRRIRRMILMKPLELYQRGLLDLSKGRGTPSADPYLRQRLLLVGSRWYGK